MKRYLFLLIIVPMFLSCKESSMYRAPIPGFAFTLRTYSYDEESLEYKMQMALLIHDEEARYNEVETLLRQGANPDKMAGQFKWIDTNPLWIVCRNEKLTRLFISYGADVKKRPYVAKSMIGRIALTREQYDTWIEEGYLFVVFEDDALSILKLLLENGADPNLKWIGGEKVLIPATDWNYSRYFKKHGKSAIDYAIQANSLKIYTLLIEYGAKLDENSLSFARETSLRTGSYEMEELVNKQWKIQQDSN